MKIRPRTPIVFAAITLCLPAAADTIYSNLLNTVIPTDFTGVSVTVNGGTINPFFGGVGVANNGGFQPVRDGNGNLDTIQNLGVGSLVDVNRLFSTGSGGSQDHLGDTFLAGVEGFIGFRTGAGNYGWMRVIFTGNTSGAVIKDWAYDNSGAAINVGRVQQGEAVGNAQLVTLSPGTGESFTLGSAIADNGSIINSVDKVGAGITTLSNASYTGSTTLSGGRLVLNDATGFASNSVTLTSGTFEVRRTTDSQTLGGTLSGSGTFEKSGGGTVTLTADSSSFAGKTLVSGGTLALGSGGTLGATNEVALAGGTFDVGAKIGGYTVAKLTGSGAVTGSLNISNQLAIGNSAGTVGFENLGLGDAATAVFELGGGAGDLANVSGNLTLDGNLDLNLLAGESFVLGQVYTLFAYNGTLSGAFNNVADGGILTDAGGDWRIDYAATSSGLNGGTLGSDFVTATAVPEPGAALIGGLGLLVLLRRRRK